LKEDVFGLEPTGNYHKPLAHWLIQHDYPVVLVAGKAVKDNRELLDGRWDKNDTKDSANAADLVSQGKCQFYEQADSVMIAVRNLIAVRKQLKKEEHKLRMRIRNGLIVKYFPELDRHWGSCLEENLAIVRWYLDPQKIAGTDFNLFVRHVTTTDRGLRQVQRLKAIHQAVGQSIGLPKDGRYSDQGVFNDYHVVILRSGSRQFQVVGCDSVMGRNPLSFLLSFPMPGRIIAARLLFILMHLPLPLTSI
jgi:transposase